MTAHPRRTCPACARRYAGLVSPDCPVCQGLGVLNLGAAALHNFEPAPVARAVELYIEATAQRVRHELPLGQHRDALEAAVDELRLAGVLASTADASGQPAHARQPIDSASVRVAEIDAYRAARQLGTPVTTRVTAALDAPLIPLGAARPRDGRPPQASANGHRSATATIADPIDPIGPDSGELEVELRAAGHSARVLAAAVPLAAEETLTHEHAHRTDLRPLADEGTEPTLEELVRYVRTAPDEALVEYLDRLLSAARTGSRCHMLDHEHRIAELEHHATTLTPDRLLDAMRARGIDDDLDHADATAILEDLRR